MADEFEVKTPRLLRLLPRHDDPEAPPVPAIPADGWCNCGDDPAIWHAKYDPEICSSTRPVETGHAYTSTACQHDLHDRCRLRCKFCEVDCGCACHTPERVTG